MHCAIVCAISRDMKGIWTSDYKPKPSFKKRLIISPCSIGWIICVLSYYLPWNMKNNEIDDFFRFLVRTLPCKSCFFPWKKVNSLPQTFAYCFWEKPWVDNRPFNLHLDFWKSRSASHLRKNSGPANLDFFECLHLEKKARFIP